MTLNVTEAKRSRRWIMRLGIGGVLLASSTVVLLVLFGRLGAAPALPDVILYAGHQFDAGDSYFVGGPTPPCLKVDRLRAEGMWPLGHLAGYVERVTQGGGVWTAHLDTVQPGVATYWSHGSGGGRYLVMNPARSCFVAYADTGSP